MSRGLYCALLLFAVLAFTPRDARACDCSPARDRLVALLEPGTVVSPRARFLVVRFLAKFSPDAKPGAGILDTVLVCVDEGQETEPQIRTTHRVGYKYESFEVTPQHPLELDARCALLGPAPERELLTWFWVQQGVGAPPSFRGFVEGETRSGNDDEGSCGDGSPEATLRYVGTTQPWFAVYSAAEGAAIDYGGAPISWVRGNRGRLSLSAGNLCQVGGNFPMPLYGERVRVGARTLNANGALSTAHEAWLPGVPNQYQRDALGLARQTAPMTPIRSVAAPSTRYASRLALWVVLGLLGVVVLVVVSREVQD